MVLFLSGHGSGFADWAGLLPSPGKVKYQLLMAVSSRE
jgi:hypothetical protein